MKQPREEPFRFTRLIDRRKVRASSLREILDIPASAGETWLMVSPHDDDLCVGSGMWIQAAAQAGIDVQVVIVTDGRMGYCSPAQKETIVDVRRAETYESFGILGVRRESVQYIGYPDGGLAPYQGRRAAQAGEAVADIAGYVGLQNAFTHHLRRTRPARVLVPAPTDMHPDHQMTHNELMISLFHAAGGIWPELGPPLDDLPRLYEMAIYCDFDQPPNLELHGGADVFATKLRSIAAFRSQEQIERLVQSQRDGGPYEYLREMDFKFYSPKVYRHLFE